MRLSPVLVALAAVVATSSGVEASNKLGSKKVYEHLKQLTFGSGLSSASIKSIPDALRSGTEYEPDVGETKRVEDINDQSNTTVRDSKFYPLNPPSIPLAVKSPYLNAWAPSGSLLSATPPNRQGNGGYLAGQAPTFWTSSYGADGEHRMGWNGFLQVDNVTYQWMGDAFGRIVAKGKDARQISFEYTSTRSIFAFEAGGVHFNVTFLTPVVPDDYLRQSIPMSYLNIDLDRSTAKGKSVQLFTDIDERWATGHDYDYDNFPLNNYFNADVNGTSMYFVQRSKPEVFKEFRQRAEWGSAVYAARNQPGMTSRTNNDVVTQLEWLTQGFSTVDHNPTLGPRNSYSFSIDFDHKHSLDSALFAIGHFRDPLVNYIRPGKKNGTSYLESRYGYWMKQFTYERDAVSFFLNDWDTALAYAKKLDAKIDADARAAVGGDSAIGDKYAAIVALSVRQSMATLEISIGFNEKTRKYNESDTLIFLKEISSNGDMSTVDVFFPQFPLLVYLNPRLLKDVMLPIFLYTESGLYPNKWAVHDLGVYPSAFGHSDGNDEPMQVEESGNMILLTLTWAQLVGKKEAVPFLNAHYAIMAQWAEFLIQDSLIPAEQLSTDDFAGTLANQTNLALKGIQGIAAMGEIATLVGKDTEAKKYRDIADKYIQVFYGYAISKSGTHTKLAYQDDKSWGTLYNLYADRLLNLKLVARELYDIQDAWYPKVAEKWAVPLDSRHKWAKTDWEMFASAVCALKSTRDLFIEKLYDFVSNGKTDSPFTDLMQATTGDTPKRPFDPSMNFLARPVVGGHLIHMALAAADKANGITADKPYQYGPKIQRKGEPRPEDEAAAFKYMEEGRIQNAPEAEDSSDPAETAKSPSPKTETAPKDDKKGTTKSAKTPVADAKDSKASTDKADKSSDAAKESTDKTSEAEAEELATRVFAAELRPVRRHRVFGGAGQKRRSTLEG